MEIRNLLAIGTGVGIEIRREDLAVVVARVRPSGVEVAEMTLIRNFRSRPAGEWGAEYAAFLRQHGAQHLAATVSLPRREVIVRLIGMAGVEKKDIRAALDFQVDSLHPYGDVPVAYTWERVATNGAVLAGLARQTILDGYLERFAEAGVALASITFSASALHAASRLLKTAPSSGFLAVGELEDGGIEVYGESPAKPVYSATFDVPAERASAVAAAELRLGPETQAVQLEQILPLPKSANGSAPVAYAAALAGASPWLAVAGNLLPEGSRKTNSRAVFIPTVALACALLLLTGALFGYSTYSERKYLTALQEEIGRLQPAANRSTAIDHSLAQADARTRLLDEFRGRAKSDLDALNELTRLLEPPVWTNLVQITRDAAVIGGEAEQAAPLLKLLDASPYFQRSAFTIAIGRMEKSEQFRVRSERERR